MSNRTPNYLPACCNWHNILLGTLSLAGLYAMSRYNFLLFHCLTEALSIIIAIAVFTIFWNTRQFLDKNRLFLVVGFACLFGGILDLIYLFAYRGMSVFPGADGNTALQAKIAAQWLVGLSCVCAFWYLRRKVNWVVTFLVYSILFALSLGAIFYWRVVPHCFVEGTGATLFARLSLIIGCCAYLGAIALLVKNRHEFDRDVFTLLIGALIALLVADSARAAAGGTAGLMEVIAHVSQIGAVLLVYKAIIEVGLTKPYALLFRSQQQSAEALERQQQFLKAVVDNAQSGIAACDANGVVTLFSRGLQEFRGLPEERIPAQRWAEYCNLYHSDGKTLMAPEELPLIRALHGERIRDLEMVIVPKMGQARTFAASAEPLRGENGENRGAVVSMHDITDRKRAEESLRAEAEFRRVIMQRAAEGLCVCHEVPDYPYVRFTVWNERMDQITGFTMDEINRLGWYQSVYPDPELQAQAVARMARMRQNDDLLAEEWEITRADRAKRLVQISTSVLQDSDGARHVLAVMHDITERKRAEETLRQSEERYRRLFEVESDAIFLVDCQSGSIVDANAAALKLYGYSRKECLSLRVSDVSAEPDRTLQAIAEGQTHTPLRRHRKKDGTVFPVDIVGSYFDYQGHRIHVAAIRDITERLRAEETLRASEARYRVLVECIPQLAWRSGPDGLDIDCNRRWYEYTGQTPAQARGQGWMAALHPDDLFRVTERAAHAINTREPYEIEYRLRRASDASYRWHLARAIPSLGEDGQMIGWVGSATDIEDLKQAQEILNKAHDEQLERHRAELAHVARLSMMGEMAAGLAHELNQPLHAINNYASGSLLRLQETPQRDQELVAALQKVSEEANRAAAIVRWVKGFVQKREPQFSEVSMNKVVEEVVLLSKAELEQRHAKVALELSENLPVVMGDPVQIEQVIMNLVRNGLEAMEEVPEEDRVLGIKTMQRGDDRVQLEVCDRGKGIGREDLKEIFEPFFTTKPEGMGMGLAISRSIVQAHGGRLWLSANQHEGCTFHFTLPVGKRS